MFRFRSFLLVADLGVTNPISVVEHSLLELRDYMDSQGAEELPWKEMMRNPDLKGVCHRTSKILDPIRGTNPKLTIGMIDKALTELEKPSYSMSYGEWNRDIYPEALEVSYRNVEEKVMRINQAGKLQKEIEADPILRRWVSLAESGSQSSGHSTERGTVGWLRIDEVNKDFLLVDEIQSDIVNSLFQVKYYVESENFEEFKERIGDNPKFWSRWRQFTGGNNEPAFRQMKQMFQGQGFNSEIIDHIKKVLNNKFRDWAEVGMATLLKLAKEEGIGMVLINTEEVYKQRDPNFGSEKYMKFYKTIADKMGFKPVTINTPEISGTFLGRKP